MHRFLLDLGCPSFGEAEVDWSPAENLLVDALGMASLKQPSTFDFDYIATICTFFDSIPMICGRRGGRLRPSPRLMMLCLAWISPRLAWKTF